MNGNLMYEIAKQRAAEQQRAARDAARARSQRAAKRGRHGKEAPDAAAGPAIPDFAHEMFGLGTEDARAGHARPGR